MPNNLKFEEFEDLKINLIANNPMTPPYHSPTASQQNSITAKQQNSKTAHCITA